MAEIIIVHIAINLAFRLSLHNQGQNSKTISKNKSMHSRLDNNCETHFHLLCMVLRSFIRHNTIKLFLFFYCAYNIK